MSRTQSRCKYCNKVIEWVTYAVQGESGPPIRIALDINTPTYVWVDAVEDSFGVLHNGFWKRSHARVAHVATCKEQLKAEKTSALKGPLDPWWNKY